MEDKIISYKGMNKNMQCRGMQYEVGKDFSADGDIECCGNGLHACERPLDVFDYYAPGTGARYFRVEQSGKMVRGSNDSKVASSKMRVDAEIGIRGLVKAHIDYVKAHTTMEHIDYVKEHITAEHTNPKRAIAGYRGAATAGNCGAATAGYRGAATAGDLGAATAGDLGAATAGNCGAATAGDRGAATAGDLGAATAGNCGAATSRGRASVGENGIASARCSHPMAKGGIGAVLALARERDDNYDLLCWNSAVVDGKTIKANTWYTIDDDGEFVEVEEGAQA